MVKHLKLIRQVGLFGLVGVASLLIDLCVTTALYNYAHFPPYLAGTLGFLSAFFFNFPINRKHVFNHTEHDKFSLKIQVISYISLSLFNLFITGLFMQILVKHLSVQVSLAKICVTGVIAVWNFLIFKFVIFSKRPHLSDVEGVVVQ